MCVWDSLELVCGSECICVSACVCVCVLCVGQSGVGLGESVCFCVYV